MQKHIYDYHIDRHGDWFCEGNPVSSAYVEVSRLYPEPGWVEQDPEELYRSCLVTASEAVRRAGIPPSQIKSLGITNQRETTIIWERRTGKPAANAVVWQCRRSAPLCEEIKRRNLEPLIREKTGLVADAYFSATKLRWLLDRIPDGAARAARGELLFGAVDSWLLWKLTGGILHATDVSNASRTMLFNIQTLEWDDELLSIFDIPVAMLPEVLPSSHDYGVTVSGGFIAGGIPIGAVAGDQQAALFGQGCYAPGMAKNTYGTGAFILLNTGACPARRDAGLLTTVAWGLGGNACYALEGSVFVAGAAVQWLRDGLGIIADAAETEAMAESLPDNGGVFFVPAFVGLGAPYWEMHARGLITGLTHGTGRRHLARAALEAVAYQTRDVISAMSSEAGVPVSLLRADGGMTANRFLMQFQADILGTPIQVATIRETTAYGAALLAGLSAGFWNSTVDIACVCRAGRLFEPCMAADERESLYAAWEQAVSRARR